MAVRKARNIAVLAGTKLATGFDDVFEADLPACLTEPTPHDYLAYLHVLGTAASTPDEEDELISSNIRSYPTGARHTPMPINQAIAHIEPAHAILDEWPNA